MDAPENAVPMEALLTQLEQWAEGEGDLPTQDNRNEAVNLEQKRALWALLNRPFTGKTTLSNASVALR